MCRETLGDLCGRGIAGTPVKAVMLFKQRATFTAVAGKPLPLTVLQTSIIGSSLLPPHSTLALSLDLGTKLRRKPWGL